MLALRPTILLALVPFCFVTGSIGGELQEVLEDVTNHGDVDGSFVGVGFDLTASYGVAAVSYPNGTTSTVAKIGGAPAYKELLSRLSLASSTHPTPPYSSLQEMMNDQARQAKRRTRKAKGLPASEDVAVLSTMLQWLREAVENYFRHTIHSAVASIPHLVALYPEDLHDAFEYVGLKRFDLPVRYGLLRESAAAYAGYGFGLCSNYTDRPACKAEQQNAPDDVVMTVLYTTSALTATLSVMKSAYYLWEPQDRRVEDFGLGSDARYDNPNEHYYWEQVRDCLRQILVEQHYYEKPRKVLLLGESARDKVFIHILEESLLSVMDDLPEMYTEGAEGVAALGAAELAKRAPWDPYKLLSNSENWDTFDNLNEQRDRLG